MKRQEYYIVNNVVITLKNDELLFTGRTHPQQLDDITTAMFAIAKYIGWASGPNFQSDIKNAYISTSKNMASIFVSGKRIIHFCGNPDTTEDVNWARITKEQIQMLWNHWYYNGSSIIFQYNPYDIDVVKTEKITSYITLLILRKDTE